ncbi:ABC transporter permease [Ornithinimicrobium sp. Y1847]|uniref:ABC transporter permease n=1 Tax=unclassified Ornithinimicrobium TaxID=2615080 RepID=UPI003B6741D1
MPHPELDSTSLAYSGTIPPHSQMAARSRRFGWWYYTETYLRGMRAYALPILFYAVGQPLLYLIAMGVGLAALVSGGVGSVDGVDYLTFVAPALLVSTVVMSVSGEMTYPVMSGFKWNRLYYGPAASPVSPGQIAVGHFTAVCLRFLIQSFIFWVVMVAFGAAPQVLMSLLLVPLGVLAAMAFGAPLQAYAATVKDEGFQFTFVQRFIVMPMFLFAGTFFPLSVMPIYLQWIGWISPVWHGTQLARVASYGAPVEPWLIAVHLLFLIVCVVGGLTVAVRVYRGRLTA